MLFSHQTFHFTEHTNHQILQIQNQKNNLFIFKVKTTNTELFIIYPGKGFLRRCEKVSISIKLSTFTEVNAKLLIAYSQIQGDGDRNFDNQWGKLRKQDIQNQLIDITIEKADNGALKLRQTESPIYEFDQTQNQIYMQKHEQKEIGNGNLLSRSVKSSVKMMQNSIGDVNGTNDIKKNRQEKDYQRQLQAIKTQNQKLKQSLKQQQRRIRYHQNVNQGNVNKSMNNYCEQFRLSLGNVVLLCLICFSLGFFMAKYKQPHD